MRARFVAAHRATRSPGFANVRVDPGAGGDGDVGGGVVACGLVNQSRWASKNALATGRV